MGEYDERHAPGCPRRSGMAGRGSGCSCDTGETGPVPTVADPIDSADVEEIVNSWPTSAAVVVHTLCDEVDRLRAENAALVAVADAVLEDAFGTDDDPNCIVDGRLLARLRDALAALEAGR